MGRIKIGLVEKPRFGEEHCTHESASPEVRLLRTSKHRLREVCLFPESGASKFQAPSEVGFRKASLFSEFGFYKVGRAKEAGSKKISLPIELCSHKVSPTVAECSLPEIGHP